MPRADLIGRRFGRLVALGIDGSDKWHQALWACVCDCGETCRVVRASLVRGVTTSCGCKRAEHGRLMMRTMWSRRRQARRAA